MTMAPHEIQQYQQVKAVHERLQSNLRQYSNLSLDIFEDLLTMRENMNYSKLGYNSMEDYYEINVRPMMERTKLKVEDRVKAVELLSDSDLSLREIAGFLGISKTTVARDLRRLDAGEVDQAVPHGTLTAHDSGVPLGAEQARYTHLDIESSTLEYDQSDETDKDDCEESEQDEDYEPAFAFPDASNWTAKDLFGVRPEPATEKDGTDLLALLEEDDSPQSATTLPARYQQIEREDYVPPKSITIPTKPKEYQPALTARRPLMVEQKPQVFQADPLMAISGDSVTDPESSIPTENSSVDSNKCCEHCVNNIKFAELEKIYRDHKKDLLP